MKKNNKNPFATVDIEDLFVEELISVIKKAFADLQENVLNLSKPLVELPNLINMSKMFNMSVQRAAVFATIYCRSEIEGSIAQDTIIGLLRNYFQGQSRQIRMEIKELTRVEFIERNREDRVIYFSVRSKIIHALDQNDLQTLANAGPKGLESALEFFKKKLLDHDILSRTEVQELMDDIRNVNETINVIRYCEAKGFIDTIYDGFVCLAVCAKAALDQSAFNFNYLVNYIPFSRKYIQILRHEILDGTWAPMVDGLIENAGGDMVEYDPELRLTAKGYDYFLKELDPEYLKMIRSKVATVKTPMIRPQEIQKVKMHFDDEFAQRTCRLTDLLRPEAFVKYQSNFPKFSKMKGLTMLFHGGPGCGKTEFALQLSRLTGRPIMKVEVTDFQSKWVGESEKQIKQIFADYKLACNRMGEKFPILFFNECDQIIGRRVGIRSSVDQMTNAVQNIILEEMENFNGIMIGTTNLTENMDPAFERRWVMKMKFESPNEAARIAIWKSAIKGLRQSEAQELVKQFDLTPGEISNISRRFVIENMLGLTQSRLITLKQLCESEHYYSNMPAKSIGFSLEKSFQQNAKAN